MAIENPEAVQQLLNWFYVFMGLVTVETLIIIWAKNDVKIGVRKWFLKKTGKIPIVVRVVTPNRGVEYYVVPTKGKGDTLEVSARKGLLAKLKNSKDDDSMTFFLEPSAIRMGQDNVPEITYTNKSVMPVDEQQTAEQVKKEEEKFVKRFNYDRKVKAEKEGREYVAVEPEDLIKFTDPKRLNKWTDLVYLAAKRQALKESGDLEKYVKWAFYAAAAAAGVGLLTWYTLDGTAIPLLESIKGSVSNIGTTILTPN